MANSLEFREMVGISKNGVVLLEALEIGSTSDRRDLSLYFETNTDPNEIELPTGAEVRHRLSIGNALILKVSAPKVPHFLLKLKGEPVKVKPNKSETGRFTGSNAVAALRNGETAKTILEWLVYHGERQGMNAAIIVDRAQPNCDTEFDSALLAGITDLPVEMHVTILRSPQPLGWPHLPSEAHPYCAPAAPGRARMKLPPPDPQRSPISALSVYEIVRERFLNTARAVANIEVCDLVNDDGPGSIFDRAVADPTGVITLEGRPCYPWRIRPEVAIHFADHICIQFDEHRMKRRWCIAPAKAPQTAVWRPARVGGAKSSDRHSGRFFRFMCLRHRTEAVSRVVPKTALVEQNELLQLSKEHFGQKPARVPKAKARKLPKGRGKRTIVTTMKDEGPFILEWLAYHRAIGFDGFLVYTNDCTDGTDKMLDLLQRKGLVQHRDNPFRLSGKKPQHAALAAAQDEKLVSDAKWVACIDVDEFINIKTGDGTLDALFDAIPDANMISMTWRLFGNADVRDYVDVPIIEQFTRCAPEFTRKPHVAWGFKTMFQHLGVFKKLGVHRPKGLVPQLRDHLTWLNGSGHEMPETMYRNAWRSTTQTYGYDLVQLNHYAVRSAESFLVKRNRGRVNHVDRDQGLAYWFRMNNNAEEDRSILRMLPKSRHELNQLMSDPEIASAHAYSVRKHRQKISKLRATEKYSNFFSVLVSKRMRKLSRMHSHFGTNVFLSGPDCVPSQIIQRDSDEEFFFTVELE